MENNMLRDALLDIYDMWVHRKGWKVMGKEVIRDNTIHAMVHDTINALWKEGRRPIIQKVIRNKDRLKYTFLINLPPGNTYSEFKSKEEHFQDATGGAVHIEKRGKRITMEVLTMELKTHYPYEFNPENYPDMYLPIPIGWSAMGLIVKDLADIINLFSAGHPGAGKTNFLKIIVASLVAYSNAQIAIIDRKRVDYRHFKKHALVVTDIEGAREVLTAINKKLDDRLILLENADAGKIQEYKGDLPFIVLIIDELAEIQDEACQTLLNRIVRLGRAAGICVVAATQRPSSTLFAKFGDSKAMFTATMCYHVRDAVNSRMVLDNDKAALIPLIPGRGIFQYDDELEIQTMELKKSDIKRLLSDREVSKIDIPSQSTKRLSAR